jgi:hypothetical protein
MLRDTIWNRGRASSFGSLIPIVVLAGLASTLSLSRSGMNFNKNNNAFHIPIVLRFDSLPQFADDPFVLSLKGFATPVFPLLAQVATEANVAALFLLGVGLVHVCTVFALLRIGQALGITRWGELALLALAIIATRTSYWVSPVGGDGMLVDYFSHSELARVFALLAIAALLEGRRVAAGALAGVALIVNVAFGVWMAGILAAGLLPPVLRRLRAGGWGSALRFVAPPLLAFAVVAAPGVAFVLSRAELGGRPDFDYVEFLYDYYPNHFFIGPSLGWPLVQVLAALVALPLAAGLLAQPARLRRVALGLALLFGLGVLVGEVSHARLLLQLMFLRVDGIIMLVATVAAAAALIVAARGGNPLALGAAGLAAAGLLSGGWPLVVLALLLARSAAAGRWLAQGRLGAWLAQPWTKPAVVGGLVVLALGCHVAAYAKRVTPPSGAPHNVELVGSNAIVPDWLAVQRWARTETPPDAVFLLPMSLSGDFRVGAQRRIWFGWRDGATAMWAPWTYRVWRDRQEEVRALGTDVPALHAYACSHGIGYIVRDLRPRAGRPSGDPRVVFRNRWFEVHRAACGS